MRRPGWWPRGWPWPGPEPTPGATSRLPDAPPGAGPRSPAASFLRTLVEAFGAERAWLLALDRERGAWRLEREMLGAEGEQPLESEVEAVGHPLTWCVREELVVQVPAGDLTDDRGREGWALAGPVPGRDRTLVLIFHGAPPAGARRAMRPALDHLSTMGRHGDEEEGAAGRQGGEPFDRPGGTR